MLSRALLVSSLVTRQAYNSLGEILEHIDICGCNVKILNRNYFFDLLCYSNKEN